MYEENKSDESNNNDNESNLFMKDFKYFKNQFKESQQPDPAYPTIVLQDLDDSCLSQFNLKVAP